jgi:hypothetical protein
MNKSCALLGLLIVVMCATVGHAAQLVGNTSGECIDVPNRNTADGTPMSLFTAMAVPTSNGPSTMAKLPASGASASTPAANCLQSFRHVA